MKLLLVRCLALVASLFGVGAHGEAPFSFDTTPGQLPKEIVPRHYAIRIEPDIEQATLRGTETIDIEVRKPVSKIVLNSLGLKITRAILRTPAEIALAPQIDEKKETLTCALPSELAPGRYQLELSFEGKLTEQPEGLYLTRYASAGEEKRALITQFEATDARRMFPCWDEPVFRAEFQLTTVVPATHVAVSNMPITAERPIDGGKKEVAFAKTPSMVSYLVAFCTGEFEALEGETEGIALRVLTTEGKRHQARYALEATKQLLPYFNRYFGVKYPLPKLDQLSFASTAASGMENWGCIIYNDTAFLYDPATSPQSTRERVFAVVAHEIAHQWFGDLVTMAWWDNLWLNEGFASWMGTKATDHFNPTWKAWLRAAESKERAMRLDARATTHPIQQKVENEAQAGDAFDEIAYSKGQAFIRMLETWLGENVFRDGLRLYMKRHAWSNSTTADLWNALAEVSGQPVREMAAGWTEQPGFPLVKVDQLGANKLRLSQERFAIHQTDPPPLTWKIPVTLGSVSSAKASIRKRDSEPGAHTVLLEAKPIDTAHSGGRPVKLNLGDTGYYRVAYDAKLFERLLKDLPALPEGDRLNLLNDSWALVAAKRQPVATYLDLVSRFQSEPGYPIVQQIVRALGEIDFLARKDDGRERFHSWAREFLRPQLDRLGWTTRPKESPLDQLLRATIIRQLGFFGDQTVLAEARARYEKFLADPGTLTGDLRGAVLEIVGRRADDATYERLRDLARAEKSTEQKQQLYAALAHSLDPKHAAQTLALSVTNELVPRAATRLVIQVALDGEHPDQAWTFAKANLDALLAKQSSIKANDYVPAIFRAFSDPARADELEQFAASHLPADAAPLAARAADEVRFKAELKSRILPEIDAWCRTQARP